MPAPPTQASSLVFAALLTASVLTCACTAPTGDASNGQPSAAGERLGEAIVYLRTGDLTSAEEALAEAQRLDPDHPTIPSVLERIEQERVGRKAIDDLKNALDRGEVQKAKAAFDAMPPNSQARSEAVGLAYDREIQKGLDLLVLAQPALGEKATRRLLGLRYQTPHRFPIETRGRLGNLVAILPSGDFIAGSCNVSHPCRRHEGWLGLHDALMQPTDAPQFIADIPRHYALSLTEARASEYLACVRAGACSEEHVTAHSEASPLCNLGHPDRGDHPINCVDFEGAKQFCSWIDGRLPTEIEWERAARGANARPFPWGKDLPNCALSNHLGAELPCSVPPMTRPVFAQADGLSPYGMFNASGNVAEWTASPWRKGTYAPAGEPWPEGANPTVRGGGFESAVSGVRTTSRGEAPATARKPDIGLRCAFKI